MHAKKNWNLTLLSMILAGGVYSAPPCGTQGMKGPWAIGLNRISNRIYFPNDAMNIV